MLSGRRHEFVSKSRRELWSVIISQYVVENIVNHGREGTVIRKAINRLTKREVALKIIPITSRDVKQVAKCEIDLLSLLNPHQHVVEYIESYISPEEVVVVLEFCAGGDLLDEVNRAGALGEERARNLLLQCISGLRHMHLLGVAHRDIKLENLLITPDQQLKLADFGFASRYLPGQLLSDSRGTLAYAAPEMLMPPGKVLAIPEATDVWSLGVVLFAMLYGALPFEGSNDAELATNIMKRKIHFPSKTNCKVSNEAQELVLSMLQLDGKLRPKLGELISHPWIVNETQPPPSKRPCSRQVPDGVIPTAAEAVAAMAVPPLAIPGEITPPRAGPARVVEVVLPEENQRNSAGSQNPSPERTPRQQNRPAGPLPAVPPKAAPATMKITGSKRAHTPLQSPLSATIAVRPHHQRASTKERPPVSAAQAAPAKSQRHSTPAAMSSDKKKNNSIIKSLLRPFDFWSK